MQLNSVSSSPQVLTYDHHSSSKDPRARWLLPAYGAGAFAAGLFLTPIAIFLNRHDPMIAILINGICVPLGLTLTMLFLDMLFMGCCIWLRQKIIKEVRFARPRYAMAWGFAIALFPPPIMLQSMADGIFLAIALIAFLLWHLILPVVAGFFLSYRSHLRD